MSRTPKAFSSRKGTVLVGTLACLCVVIAMVMFTVQSSLRGRKQARMQRQLLQTELLCEAGVKRAVQQFARSTKYRGETWMPALTDTPFEVAVVDIRLEPSTADANLLRAEVIASLASSEHSNDRMQRSHLFEINVPFQPLESKP